MMSANAVKLKKKAADFEQKKQFDKALSLYIELLEDNPRELDDSDLQLYNRVGDLLTRQGNVTDSLTWYEKAIDVYAERGFLNNAIALCNKILRQSPSRAAIYYKLGKISATKGFKSDAKKNFLEYADRMQHAGQVDEAFRALKEFADLCPDQDDVRLMLAEWLARENRKSEAVEQLETLYSKLESEGRNAEASATLTRIQAIDPAITPRASGTWIAQKPNDLIFLDLEDSSLPSRPEFDADLPMESAPPARPASPVRVPALEGLTLTFVPGDDEAGAPAEPLEGLVSSNGGVPDASAVAPLPGFEATTESPAAKPDLSGDAGRLVTDEMAAERRAASEQGDDIDLSDVLATPLQEHRPGAPVEEPGDAAPLEIDLLMLPPVGATAEQAAIASPLPETLDLIIEEHAPSGKSDGSESEELDDAIAAAFFDLGATEPAPSASIESIDMIEPVELIEMPDVADPHDRPGTSEFVAIDGSGRPTDELLLILESEPELTRMPLGDALPRLELPILDTAEDDAAVQVDEAEIEAAFERTADVVGDDLQPVATGDEPSPELADDEPAGAIESAEPTAEDVESTAEPFQVADEPVSDETFGVLPTFGEDAEETPFAPEPVLPEDSLAPDEASALADTPAGDWSEDTTPEVLIDGEWRDEHVGELGSAVPPTTGSIPPAPVRFDDLAAAMLWPPAPGSDEEEADEHGGELEQGRAVLSFGNEEAQLRRRVELDPGNWAMRRQLGEALLEFGQRAEGLDELEMAMRGLERQGDLEGAGAVANVILRVDPTSVRHHQKLVEYAVRAGDRPRLIEAYIDLADALFRSGEPGKASVVYTRVLELAPGNARAVAALGMLGPATPASAEREADAGERGVGADADDRRPSVAASAPPRLTTEMAVLGSVLAQPVEDLAVEADTPPADPPAQLAEGRVALREPTGERAVVAETASSSAPAESPPTERRPAPAPAPAPMAGSDEDFVDLGDWLRATEPERSTRMVTNEVAPTGDERADFDDMLRRFKQGVAENVDEEDYDSHYDLGVAFKEMGLVDEAISEFQKALRGENQRVRAYEALGQCFVEKGQMQVAVTLLRRACETTGADDQQLVGVLYLLGFASQSTGRHGDALGYYQRVFAVDIAFRDVAQRVADLEHSTS